MAHFKVFSLIFDVFSSAETPLTRYSYLNLYEGLFSRETKGDARGIATYLFICSFLIRAGSGVDLNDLTRLDEFRYIHHQAGFQRSGFAARGHGATLDGWLSLGCLLYTSDAADD